MSGFFHLILTQPLLNILIWLHNIIPGNDLGWAIIALTVLVRLLLLPLYHRQLRSQQELQKLQPQLEAIKQKHKDDREAQAQATMEFYREHKVNPLSSCLPLLIQLPILIALYRVFLTSLNGNDLSQQLYGFVTNPGIINTSFLGLIDLSQRSLVLAVLAGAFQFVQSKMLVPKRAQAGPQDNISAVMNKQFVYVFPVLTVFISLSLPSGLALYWVVTTLFAILQQWYIMKRQTP